VRSVCPNVRAWTLLVLALFWIWTERGEEITQFAHQGVPRVQGFLFDRPASPSVSTGATER
jgi:hypothetical protein